MTVSGALPQKDLNDLLHSVDVVLFLKFQDSCPNLAVESLACGTPVILSNTNGLLDILKPPKAIKVDIDGPKQLGRRTWTKPPFYRPESVNQALQLIYDSDKPVIQGPAALVPAALDITGVALAYCHFFRSLLDGD